MTVFSVIAMLTMSGCFSDSAKSNRATHIDFENTELDMGKLTQIIQAQQHSVSRTPEKPPF